MAGTWMLTAVLIGHSSVLLYDDIIIAVWVIFSTLKVSSILPGIPDKMQIITCPVIKELDI
jgi:hypothetical protein